jgi:MoaA/NifB/PqqE/SkfB family radical SAM enzyme
MMTNKEFVKFYSEYIKTVQERKTIIDATYICPLQCPLCARQTDTKIKERLRNSKDITFENFDKFLKFSKKLTFGGSISDPIYHKNFLRLLEMFSETTGKTLDIYTTATRKKPHWWKRAFELTKNNVRWTFGLDGTDQETANKYRVNTRFDEVMEVMKLGASMGNTVIWQFIVFRHNEHQIEEAKEICKKYNIILKVIKSGRWDEEVSQKHQIFPPSDKWKSGNSVTKFIMIKPI